MPMLSGAMSQFAYMGGFVVTPALLGSRYGLSVGAIALLLAPRPGAFSIASPIGGYLPTVMGERKPIVIGAAGMMAAMVAFAAASAMSGGAGLGLIVVGLLLTGLSAGISQPAAGAMIVGAVDDDDMGIANGMNQQVMFIGVVSGIQTMNVFVGDDATSGQFALTFAIGAVVAGLGVVAALAARERPWERCVTGMDVSRHAPAT
jgi:MFS family permease